MIRQTSQHTIAVAFAVRWTDSLSITQLKDPYTRRQHKPAKGAHRAGFRRCREAAQNGSKHQHNKNCQWNEGGQKLPIDNAAWAEHPLRAGFGATDGLIKDADNDVDNVRSGQEGTLG